MNCQQLTNSISNIKAQLTELDKFVIARKPGEAILIKNKIEAEFDKYELRIGYRFKEAKVILGQDFLGPEEIKAVFGLESIEVPPIPFSIEDLKRAKELGQMLILHLPITMAEINEKLRGKVKNGKKLLYSFDESTAKLRDRCWYKDEPFYTTQTARPGWALVTKHVLGHKDGEPEEDTTKDSTNKNYLQQTEILIKYLQDEVFKDKIIPPKYQEAIAEFEKEKAGIAAIVSSSKESEWKEAARKLKGLIINKLIRRLPVETLYDITACFQTTGERLLPGIYDWSSVCSSGGYLVCVGNFEYDGVDVIWDMPVPTDPGLGAVFSRSQ